MSGYEVDPGELFAARSAVLDAAEQGRAELARLRAAADDLLGHGWRGGAADAFARGWQEWADGARTVLAALDETARALGTTGAAYADTEDRTTSDLRRIA